MTLWGCKRQQHIGGPRACIKGDSNHGGTPRRPYFHWNFKEIYEQILWGLYQILWGFYWAAIVSYKKSWAPPIIAALLKNLLMRRHLDCSQLVVINVI